jgi:hypothetical protein
MWWFVLLAFPLLSACIYIPAPIEPEPYEGVNFDSIEPRKSTRTEVVELLGEPAITRREDSIWLYGRSRDVGYVVTLLGEGGRVKDHQFLVFEFNQDYVKSFELVEEGLGCSSNGICLAHAWRLPYQISGVPAELTLMVRQLAPGPEVVPIVVYCFTNTTNWGEYEGIQADIFDHFLAIVPEFVLRLYQKPAGADLARL